jgi:hypothetical protein
MRRVKADFQGAVPVAPLFGQPAGPANQPTSQPANRQPAGPIPGGHGQPAANQGQSRPTLCLTDTVLIRQPAYAIEYNRKIEHFRAFSDGLTDSPYLSTYNIT